MSETRHPEFQYLDLLKTIINEPNESKQPNRTGIDCWTIPGAMMKFDLSEGYPLFTTKQTFFKSIKGELIGFLRGVDNAEEFRELGCKIWDQNANENKDWLANKHRYGTDDLGRIYGVQWRDWATSDGKSFDQLHDAIDTIITNPYSRRIIINAWRPDEFDRMALPPCHVMYQFIPHVSTRKLHLCMYQRSCDMFLGVPFNTASSALFLSLMAKWTGFEPGTFTHFLADAHVYENHMSQVVTQLMRDPFPFPTLNLDLVPDYQHRAFDKNDYFGRLMSIVNLNNYLNTLTPDMIRVDNYQHHEAIRAPMAV
jgi:thymidylate synthase